ncbi:uncharacterized protein SCHCODRAFT_02685198 [Schizophyllum commune H4-8]|nr:uncharacterized protein SCHCODRAFT_02685198 [Schizophyllum commune H4-8]KAI5896131.1 hypothetical protein SCHCODRAFT_02685198 [Schizophyllum commune H4-8]
MDLPPSSCCPDYHAIAKHLRAVKTVDFTLKANKSPPSDWNLFHHVFCRKFSRKFNPARNSTLCLETRQIRMGTLAGRHWRELPQDEQYLWRKAATKLRQRHKEIWPNFVHHQTTARSKEQRSGDAAKEKNQSRAKQAAKSCPSRKLTKSYPAVTVTIDIQRIRSAARTSFSATPQVLRENLSYRPDPVDATAPMTAEIGTPHQDEVPSAPVHGSVLGEGTLTPSIALHPLGLEGFPALSLRDFAATLPYADKNPYELAFP